MRYWVSCLLLAATPTFACDEQLLKRASAPNEIWQILDQAEQAEILSLFDGDMNRAWQAMADLQPRITQLSQHVAHIEEWSPMLRSSYRKLLVSTVRERLTQAYPKSAVIAPRAEPNPLVAYVQDALVQASYDLNRDASQYQKQVFQSAKVKVLLDRFWLVERDMQSLGKVSRTHFMMLVTSPLSELEHELTTHESSRLELEYRAEDLAAQVADRLAAFDQSSSLDVESERLRDLLVGAQATANLLQLQLAALKGSVRNLEVAVREIQSQLVTSLQGDSALTPKHPLYLSFVELKKVMRK